MPYPPCKYDGKNSIVINADMVVVSLNCNYGPTTAAKLLQNTWNYWWYLDVSVKYYHIMLLQV